MIRKALDQTMGFLTVLAPESPAPLLQAAVLGHKTQPYARNEMEEFLQCNTKKGITKNVLQYLA